MYPGIDIGTPKVFGPILVPPSMPSPDAVPARWHRMSVMLSAASCLDWTVALTGPKDVPALLSLSLEANPRSDLLFLPYLSGERIPHANPAAQGVFFGLTGSTG